jgi:hypothetical protein
VIDPQILLATAERLISVAASVRTYTMGNHIWPLIILVLIYLAPVASIATDNTSNLSTVITANTIASWNTLSSSITAAAGKVVTLTLSTPFDMTGFQHGSAIDMKAAQTAITIVGNGAVFNAGGNFPRDRFFNVYQAVALVMSNVTLQNGDSSSGGGGAILVYGGTITLSDCSFRKNSDGGSGYSWYAGAIAVYNGTITLSDCSFNENTALHQRYAGGALYFSSNSNGLLKNCSLLGTVSPNNNDIYRQDTTANVTFACADGEVGTPVQMSGTEITKIPELHCR